MIAKTLRSNLKTGELTSYVLTLTRAVRVWNENSFAINTSQWDSLWTITMAKHSRSLAEKWRLKWDDTVLANEADI